MVERRTLEDVLNDLKEAEAEYKEKCLKYGITEKHKRKKNSEEDALEVETSSEEPSEDYGQSIEETSENDIAKEVDNEQEISEN